MDNQTQHLKNQLVDALTNKFNNNSNPIREIFKKEVLEPKMNNLTENNHDSELLQSFHAKLNSSQIQFQSNTGPTDGPENNILEITPITNNIEERLNNKINELSGLVENLINLVSNVITENNKLCSDVVLLKSEINKMHNKVKTVEVLNNNHQKNVDIIKSNLNKMKSNGRLMNPF